MKTTFWSFGRGRTIIGYIRQPKIFRDLVRKNPLFKNFLKMCYCLILILWNIFLTVPLVEISAHYGLNLTSPRTIDDECHIYHTENSEQPSLYKRVIPCLITCEGCKYTDYISLIQLAHFHMKYPCGYLAQLYTD